MKKHFNNHGFTLIEMLVVIAIIGILTGIIVTNMSGAKAKARDAKRISDLGQIQMALELYFDRCGMYPYATDGDSVGQGGGGQCNKTKPNGDQYTMSDFIDPMPTPPIAGETYKYASIDSGDYIGSNYTLHTSLESPNAVQTDSVKNDRRGFYVGDKFSCFVPGSGPATPSLDYCIGSPGIRVTTPATTPEGGRDYGPL